MKVNDVKKAEDILKKNGFLNRYNIQDNTLVLYDHFEESHKINEVLVKNGVDVYEIAPSNIGFEDYFIERIGR